MTKYTKSIIDGTTELEPLFSLGSMFVSSFLKPDEQPNPKSKHELKLGWDKNNHFVQLMEQPPGEFMWGSFYNYYSGTTEKMRKSLKNVVDCLLERSKKSKGVYCDVASNDFTTLSFVPNTFLRVGIDPSNYWEFFDKKKADCFIQDYFIADTYFSKIGQKADLLSMLAVFYDLPNPVETLNSVGEILSEDGIAAIQLTYSPVTDKLLEVGNYCFTEDAWINGVNKKISDVEVGDKVFSKNGRWTEVTKTFKHEYNGKLYTIKPRYLEKFSVTSEHPILTIQKKNLEIGNFEATKWKAANKIEITDYLVVPKLESIDKPIEFDLKKYWHARMDNTSKIRKFVITEDIAWLFGIWVAEGNVGRIDGNSVICFTLNINEVEYHNEIIRIFKESFGYTLKFYPSKVAKSTQGVVSFKKMAHFLIEEFGRGAKNKKIPKWLMTASEKIKMSFLKGLFAGDGYYKNSQIHLHSASHSLCSDVQILLASIGCMTGLSYAPVQEPHLIQGRLAQSGESWQVRGKSKRISELFGLDNSKNRDKNPYYYENDRYFFIRIKEIKDEHYSGKVFNFETKKHTYLASNCVTHNCSEHLAYYSLLSLQKVIEKSNLLLREIELNDVNGGSIRLYLQKKDSKNYLNFFEDAIAQTKIKSLELWERNEGYDTPAPYLKFYEDISKLRDKAMKFLRGEKKKGKVIFGAASSTKANTLLPFFGLDNEIVEKIGERQEKKWGLRTVGTNIPICSEDEMRRDKPDYIILFAWFFLDEFLAREKNYLDQGGVILTICPELRAYTKNGNFLVDS